MSLQQWANNGWLRVHQTSPKEIQDLLKIVEYDYAGGATKKDADELVDFTRELRTDVRVWLQENHIELLLPDGDK
jgi:hypothetical protein